MAHGHTGGHTRMGPPVWLCDVGWRVSAPKPQIPSAQAELSTAARGLSASDLRMVKLEANKKHRLIPVLNMF